MKRTVGANLGPLAGLAFSAAVFIPVLVSCGSAQESASSTPNERIDDVTTVGGGIYTDAANRPRELLTKPVLVVLAEPVGEEFLLAPDRGGDSQIMGQRVRLLEVLKGNKEAGAETTVIRTDFLASEVIEDQPPFKAPLYLLALESTEGSYGQEAWFVLGGPSGRIAFARQSNDEMRSFVETESNHIQTVLANRTPEEVKQAIRP